MKISHSSFSKATKSHILQILALWCAFLASSEVRADGYEECRQILTQDIFNKVIKSDSSSAYSSAVAISSFFQMTADEAYEKYDKDFKKAQKEGKTIDAEGHYGIIGGELGINLTSEKEVSESEFKEKFTNKQSTYSKQSSTSSVSNQNLLSNYASYVRDSRTVDAWKDCITRTKETNLYAFASRDNAGQVFVNVMWVPGLLAGDYPSIPISFITHDDKEGVKVLAKPEEHIGMGSGRYYAVICGKKCDNGFQVTINGTLKNHDFATIVEVPPLNPPTPPKPDLSKLSDDELSQEYERLVDIFSERCVISSGGYSVLDPSFKARQTGNCKAMVEVLKLEEFKVKRPRPCDFDRDEACYQKFKALFVGAIEAMRAAE